MEGVNWIGVATLYRREVQRFLAVAAQTVGGPVVSALLFLTVFGVALGRHAPALGGVSYLVFIAPGLVMMAVLQNAFANTSSSLLVATVQGTIVDLLLAPLGPGEFLAGLALGGVTRGLVVGMLTVLAAALFVSLPLANPVLCLFYAVSTLPEPFRSIAYLDPVFYLVNGFRYGITGHSEAPPLVGILVVLVVNILLGILCHRLLASGWRLRQ